MLASKWTVTNLKQNKAQSAHTEYNHKSPPYLQLLQWVMRVLCGGTCGAISSFDSVMHAVQPGRAGLHAVLYLAPRWQAGLQGLQPLQHQLGGAGNARTQLCSQVRLNTLLQLWDMLVCMLNCPVRDDYSFLTCLDCIMNPVVSIQWYPSLTPAGMCWKCTDTGMFTGEAEHNATHVGHTCLYSSSEGILQCYKCGTCINGNPSAYLWHKLGGAGNAGIQICSQVRLNAMLQLWDMLALYDICSGTHQNITMIWQWGNFTKL